jgi:GNAT superfamily N-acetyltransferase
MSDDDRQAANDPPSGDQPQMETRIRHATAADTAALSTLAATAFRDTYSLIDDAQDVEDHIAEYFPVDILAVQMRDPASTFLLMESPEGLIGYAQLKRSPAPPCVTGPAPLELARLYLRRQKIGKGLGARLMRAVHDDARDMGYRTLWLGVYDRNLRAIAFYRKCGFVEVGHKQFKFGRQLVIDPIMAMPVAGTP